MTDLRANSPEIPSGRTASGPAATAFVPQFAPSTYGKAATLDCTYCDNRLYSSYFLVDRKKVCESCAGHARSGYNITGPGSVPGAMVFGLVGTLLATSLYSALAVSTPWPVYYATPILGIFVGYAVHIGAERVGGLRFQAVAAILTYLAMSLATLPGVLYAAFRHGSDSGDLLTLLQNSAWNGIVAPFQGFGTNSGAAILSLVILAIGMRIASHFNRVKPYRVAGPLYLKAAA